MAICHFWSDSERKVTGRPVTETMAPTSGGRLLSATLGIGHVSAYAWAAAASSGDQSRLGVPHDIAR